jgi:hypothetical protein
MLSVIVDRGFLSCFFVGSRNFDAIHISIFCLRMTPYFFVRQTQNYYAFCVPYSYALKLSSV